mmetsp:Transcript_2168/g.9187  ORF Transcript_2168/g.9187 Transcript_2168/m.9187 type:complete len:328 (+) Transcript_2168:1072-2055(+)
MPRHPPAALRAHRNRGRRRSAGFRRGALRRRRRPGRRHTAVDPAARRGGGVGGGRGGLDGSRDGARARDDRRVQGSARVDEGRGRRGCSSGSVRGVPRVYGGRGAGSESEGRFGRRGGRRRRFRGVGLRDGRRDGDGDVLETFRKERDADDARIGFERRLDEQGGAAAARPRRRGRAVHRPRPLHERGGARGVGARRGGDGDGGALPRGAAAVGARGCVAESHRAGEGSNADLPDVAHPAGRPVLGDVQLHILADEGSRPGLARVPPGAVGGRDDAMPWMERLGRRRHSWRHSRRRRRGEHRRGGVQRRAGFGGPRPLGFLPGGCVL